MEISLFKNKIRNTNRVWVFDGSFVVDTIWVYLKPFTILCRYHDVPHSVYLIGKPMTTY